MKICLAGNPNCGKSTLFNVLTGLNQKVGNYPGITVDKLAGQAKIDGHSIDIIDLPGAYSLYPKSLDEEVVFKTLTDPDDPNFPDLVVHVVSATQLRRCLVLATQIIDIGIPSILALNMMDEAEKHNLNIDIKTFEEELGIPVVPISATKQTGIKALKKAIIDGDSLKVSSPRKLDYPEDLLHAATDILGKQNKYKSFVNLVLAEKSRNLNAADRIKLLGLRDEFNFNPTSAMASDIGQRYKRINEIAGIIGLNNKSKSTALSTTEHLDKVLTHRWLGLPIALLALFVVFQAIFSWAQRPMNWIEAGFGSLGSWLGRVLPNGWLHDLMVEGIIPGLSGVLIFIPQIAILFGLLAILEGTGYMARISYMLDRLMRKFGLSGKAVVPMMSGFACAIPAIMATRNIKSWKERIITIMVTPLLSCSARLPVYILLIGLLIPSKKVWGIMNMQGLTMMGFYLAGIIMALLIAGILSRFLKVNENTPFLLELPRYRFPQWRNVLFTMYQKARIFAIEAGKIILLISIVLWFLASHGPGTKMKDIENRYAQLAQSGSLTADQQQAMASEKLVNSYAGHFGKAIEPVIKPLGYDWKIGIALITSFAAREVFNGTMSTIYSLDANEEDPKPLREKLRQEKDPKTGKPVYSFATVFSLLLFYAFAMQCMSTLAVVKRETNSWKWPVIQLVYLTALAYLSSFLAYQLLS